MRNAVVILFTVLLSGAAWSQSVEAPLAFEVASIKQSPSSDLRGMTVGCPADPGRITCTNVNLVYLVTMAYGIQRYQLSGLTPSPNMERYEIAVKLPEGTTRDQIGRMWQKLLADRFKLAIHRETKEAQVYELVVAKGGLKMQEWVEPPPAGEDAAPAPKADSEPGSRPKLDKDGYPELGPTTSMAIMGSKGRDAARCQGNHRHDCFHVSRANRTACERCDRADGEIRVHAFLVYRFGWRERSGYRQPARRRLTARRHERNERRPVADHGNSEPARTETGTEEGHD